MPRLKNKPPSYCFHKASGQAVVWLEGHQHYLGPYGSPESHAAYRRLITEWSIARPLAAVPTQLPAEIRADLRINELILAYLEFARGYYMKDGRPTGEYQNMKDAVRPLQALYDTARVWDFGPAALRAVRERMIAANLSRKVVNARINRIRRIFKWGVERELVDPAVLQGLQSVAPLKAGRSKARETDRVMPVPQAHIEAVLSHVTKPVEAMIRLQLVTGMRPGEVVLMRPCDIDMSGKIWEYRPASHKTQHHGKERVIFLGPQAQASARRCRWTTSKGSRPSRSLRRLEYLPGGIRCKRITLHIYHPRSGAHPRATWLRRQLAWPRQPHSTAQRYPAQVVLLSDGCHNCGPQPFQAASQLRVRATVECVGIADRSGVDEDLLKAIASSRPDGSKRYRWIGDPESLERHLDDLAGGISRS